MKLLPDLDSFFHSAHIFPAQCVQSFQNYLFHTPDKSKLTKSTLLILGKASTDFYPPFSFTTKTGIIRVWGPVEWVGAEFNGYFLVMLEVLGHHSIPKIYIHPMSKVVLLPLRRALQVFGGQLNGLQ